MANMLPPECLDNVFSNLSHDRGSLHRCMRVNRNFFSVAVQHLYRNVWIYYDPSGKTDNSIKIDQLLVAYFRCVGPIAAPLDLRTASIDYLSLMRHLNLDLLRQNASTALEECRKGKRAMAGQANTTDVAEIQQPEMCPEIHVIQPFVAAVVKRCPNLTELIVGDDTTTEILSTLLAAYPRLSKLEIHVEQLTDDHLNPIARYCRSLRHLSLKSQMPYSFSDEALASALFAQDALQTFAVDQQSPIQNASINALISKHSSSLTSLVVVGGPSLITTATTSSGVATARPVPPLSHLALCTNLHHLRISGESESLTLPHLQTILHPNMHSLSSLNFSETSLDDTAVELIATSTKGRLRSLTLYGIYNILQTKTFATLASSCPNLEHFHLDLYNKAECDGVREMVARCGTLKTLVLGGMYIERETADATIDEITARCASTLRRLDISHWKVSDDRIARLLDECAELEELVIQGCAEITDRTVDAIGGLFAGKAERIAGGEMSYGDAATTRGGVVGEGNSDARQTVQESQLVLQAIESVVVLPEDDMMDVDIEIEVAQVDASVDANSNMDADTSASVTAPTTRPAQEQEQAQAQPQVQPAELSAAMQVQEQQVTFPRPRRFATPRLKYVNLSNCTKVTDEAVERGRARMGAQGPRIEWKKKDGAATGGVVVLV